MAEKLKQAGKKAVGIHPEVLKSLVSKCNAIKSEMDEIRGELGAAVKDAEEAHGIHRKAFKLCLSLDKMEDAPRADFLRAFDDYRAKLDLNPQADLFEDGEGDEAARRAQQVDAAAEADRVAENTKTLKGIKQTQPAGVH